MTSPIVERHYILSKSTQNLSGVAQEIDPLIYANVSHRVETLGNAYERKIGEVTDCTRYYDFTGNTVFLDAGVVQVGIAKTTDNLKGFGMIRLFANSLSDLAELQRACGLALPARRPVQPIQVAEAKA